MGLEQVFRTTVEGAVLAAVVALLCAFFPRLRASHRALLWWLVSAKLLVGLVPLPAVHVEVAPVARVVAALPSASVAAQSVPAGPSRRTVLAAMWLCGVALLAAATIPGWLRLRGFLLAGRILDGEPWSSLIAKASRAAGLRRPPRVMVVTGLATPLVTGFFRPSVLLPADVLARFDRHELELTLAHEMAHIARGDLWLGLVPALARRVFFFHPAAWIAEREHAIAREAACDEVVLGKLGADAFVYGGLLLRVATRRPAVASIPMSRHSMLRRRLVMIESLVRSSRIGRAGWAAVALVALAIVPVRLLAKDVGESRCLDIGSGKDSAYVVTDGRSHSMCGDTSDIRLAEANRRKGEDVVWFRVDGRDWVVRDPHVVSEARRIFARVGDLGGQQAEIGAQQARIGERQSHIGMEQGEIGMRQAEMGIRQAEIALKQAHVELSRVEEARVREAMKEDADRDAEREAVIEVERAQAKRARQDSRSAEEIQVRMRELGERQEALGREQQVFGERQRQLGEKMTREIAEAQAALSRLLERCMRDGSASRAD